MRETLYTKAFIEDKANDEIVAVASTSVEDRHGEIVEVTGWDLKEFKANPVILWGHDHSQPLIGNATKTWVEGTGKTAKLMIKIKFQEATELARAVKQLVMDGFLKTLSVGFQPLDAEGNRFTKQKLLEVSVVNVPANPQAMMLGYKSLKDAGFDSNVITKAGYPAGLMEEVTSIKQDLAIMKNQINTAVKGLQHLNPHIGRGNRIATERLSMLKVVARAADTILAEKPSVNTVRTAKVIKRANEQIISSVKGEILNGSNQRTSRKA